MKLGDLMPLTISKSLITIVYGSETIYQGLNENLGLKINNNFFKMKISTISSSLIKIGDKYYPSLYVYFIY